jgi:uncharacterized protein YeaO (DUF488 family)
MSEYRIKRIYDDVSSDDGYRVLVDRLWPRGISKERAQLDAWQKDIAPSTELRKWFGHRSERFEEFAARYRDELQDNPTVKEFKDEAAKHRVITLLYGAHDSKINHAAVLLEYLRK